MTKPFHAGHAAAAGVWAGLLAGGGFTGAPDPLQGRRGMFTVMSSASTPADLVEGLGDRWQIFDNGVKPMRAGRGDPSGHRRGARPRRSPRVGGRSDHLDPAAGPPPGTRTDRKDRPTNRFGRQVLGDVRVCDRVARGPGRVRRSSPTRPSAGPTSARSWRVSRCSPTNPYRTRRPVPPRRRPTERPGETRVDHARGTPGNRLTDDELREKFHSLSDDVLGCGSGKRDWPTPSFGLQQSGDVDGLLELTTPGVQPDDGAVTLDADHGPRRLGGAANARCAT